MWGQYVSVLDVRSGSVKGKGARPGGLRDPPQLRERNKRKVTLRDALASEEVG